MKKALRFIGILVGIVILYCIIAIFAFPNKYTSETSIVINAPQEKVWKNVSSMKAINNWNPWMKLDKNLVGTYKGTSGEVGDTYSWKGNENVGEGLQEITAIYPMDKVSTHMHFIKPMDSHAKSDIILKSEQGATKVTWTFNSDMPTMMKPMKPYMDLMMNKSYEEGLTALKTLSEK